MVLWEVRGAAEPETLHDAHFLLVRREWARDGEVKQIKDLRGRAAEREQTKLKTLAAKITVIDLRQASHRFQITCQ